jgi:hypothetical protein
MNEVYFVNVLDALCEHGKYSMHYDACDNIMSELKNWANEEGVGLKFDYGINTTRIYLRKYN